MFKCLRSIFSLLLVQLVLCRFRVNMGLFTMIKIVYWMIMRTIDMVLAIFPKLSHVLRALTSSVLLSTVRQSTA